MLWGQAEVPLFAYPRRVEPRWGLFIYIVLWYTGARQLDPVFRVFPPARCDVPGDFYLLRVFCTQSVKLIARSKVQIIVAFINFGKLQAS